MSAENVVVTIAEYNPTAATLAELAKKFAGVTYDVTTTAGMETARVDRRALVTLRTTLETKRKELKAPALERCRLIDEEAKRLTSEILKLEAPIDTVIKAEEQRKEELRQQKAREEQERQQLLNDRIIEIGKLPLRCISMSVDEVQLFLGTLEAKEIGAEFTGDFKARAETARAEAISEIRNMLSAKKLQEEQQRIERIRKEIDELRSLATTAPFLSIDTLERSLERLETMPIGEDFYQEFRAEAQDEKTNAIQVLTDTLQEKKTAAELQARQQAELAQQQEQLRLEREALERDAAELKRQRDEKEQQEQAQREAAEAEEREKERKAREEQEARDREALEKAEADRKESERKAKAEAKARKLAEAKCADATTAFRKILAVCEDQSISDVEARAQIAIIAEGNIL
jgi:hypothetical protein